jgi:hypothetical protein
MNKEQVKEALEFLNEAGFQVGYKNDPASLSLGSTPALQGPLQGNPNLGGLFSAPGVRPDRFSAMSRVRSLSRLLTPEPSDIYNEIISIVTGATDGSGSNPSDYCGNPANPGALKQCTQTKLFGKWFSKSNLQSVNDIGYLRNRADIPGTILNSAPQDFPLIPDIMWRLADTRSTLQYELYMQGVMRERSLEQVIITGDSSKSNSNTKSGYIKEMDGLDLMIKTGYADTSGVLCPAADSIVINFGNATIGGTIGGGDGRTITQVISDLWYAAQDRATQVGMGETEFVFVGRKEMFRALTDYYSNTYATSRFQAATLTAGSPVIQIATDANNLRLEMLNGQYLIVEGIPVPFVFSDGMPLVGLGSNNYQSDLFLVPLSWQGRKLLRLEYFNLANQYITEWNGFINPEKRAVLNNGMYAMGYRSNGFCDEILFAATERLILETPFLAGRVDDIVFNYLAQTRNAIPGQSLYVNGGTSYYTPRAV